MTLNANGHTQFTPGTEKYLSAANIRGTVEFNTLLGAQIGAHTYTTLPALAK